MSQFSAAQWRASRIVRDGGVIAYPTEAVYGLGCLPDCLPAVARILRIKQRSWYKGLILIAASVEQAAVFGHIPSGSRGREILATWPGPTTWLLPCTSETPAWISGRHDSVAIRVTAHPVARALCEGAGSALVSTSANRAGKPPIRHLLRLRRTLSAEVDFIVPGALGMQASPSAIRDAATGARLR